MLWNIMVVKDKNMKEKICKFICKITAGAVCLGWCKECDYCK